MNVSTAPDPSAVSLLTEIRLLLTVSVLVASALCSRAMLGEADPKRSALVLCALFISSVLYETWQASLWPAFPTFFSLSRTTGTWLGASLVTQPTPDLRAGSCHYVFQVLAVPLIGVLWGLEEVFSHGHNARSIALVKGSIGAWTVVLLSVASRVNKMSLFVPAAIVTALGVALNGGVFELPAEAIVAGVCFSVRIALSEVALYDRGANPIRLIVQSGPLASFVVLIAFFVELGVSSGAFWSRHVLEAIGVAIPGAALAFGVAFWTMRTLVASNSLALHSWIALVDVGLLPVAARAAGIDQKMSLILTPVSAIGSLLAGSFGAFGVSNDRHPQGNGVKVDLGADDEAVVAKSAYEESEWLLRGDDEATAVDIHAQLGEKVI